MTAHATVTALRERVLATVSRHVPAGARVALIDYPNHTNVGDSAIWLGEIAALRRLGAEVAYECEAHGHDARAVRRQHLLQGLGGVEAAEPTTDDDDVP